MKSKETIDIQQLQTLMKTVNQEGGFELTLLTDEQGLPIASSSANQDKSETQAAVVSMVQKIAVQISTALEMSPTAEFVLNDVDGKRLVIRPFSAGDTELILTILLNDHRIPYRRITGSAIRTLISTWMLS